MVKIGFTLFFVCLLISCKSKTEYQQQVLIKNETTSTFTIKLFPKSEYLLANSYSFSSVGNGYRDTEFELQSQFEQELYVMDELDEEPTTIIKQVFDSIHVIFPDPSLGKIRFSSHKVDGYSENLYENDSLWDNQVRNLDFATNFRSNPVESNDYIFIISEDKYRF